MTNTRPSWVEICADEVAWIMEAAREGVPSFVNAELRPLSQNLLRAVNLTTTARDLYRIANHLGDIATAQPPLPPLVLASEEDLARAFARWCIGPDALNTFLSETFGFLRDALTRRHGPEGADLRLRAAVDAFAPTRLEVLRRLATGPRVVRVFSGPTAHMTVPALWLAANAVAGHRRAQEQAAFQSVVSRLKASFGADLRPRGALPPAVQLAAGGLAVIFGAACAATAAYRVLDMETLYVDLLNDAETLLLDGVLDGEAPVGPGLLDIIEALEHDTLLGE